MIQKREKICGIYKITSPTGAIYVGQASDIYYRWNDYKKYRCEAQLKLYGSLKKHGVENHVFEIIEICLLEKLDELEIHYIELLNTFNNELGLNLTKGGNCPMRGKTFSKESREKLSRSHKGKIKTPQQIELIRQKNIGQKRTPEAKEKMRQAKLGKPHKGKPHTEETKQLLRQKNIGKKMKPESIEKTVKGNTGKKRTPQQIENLKLGHLKFRQTEKFNSPEEREIRRNRAKKIWQERKKRIEEERRMMIF